MDSNDSLRLTGGFLRALIAADKAETELRCYLLVHQGATGVSDLNEYQSLYLQQQRAAEARHLAYMALASRTNQTQPVTT